MLFHEGQGDFVQVRPEWKCAQVGRRFVEHLRALCVVSSVDVRFHDIHTVEEDPIRHDGLGERHCRYLMIYCDMVRYKGDVNRDMFHFFCDMTQKRKIVVAWLCSLQ